MKKSDLQQLIREEIAKINESNAPGHLISNAPEVDKKVLRFVENLAKFYGYGEHDALYAIFDSLKRLGMLQKDIDFRPQ